MRRTIFRGIHGKQVHFFLQSLFLIAVRTFCVVSLN